MKKLIMLVMFLMPVFVYAEEQSYLNDVFKENTINKSSEMSAVILSNNEMNNTSGAYGLPGAYIGGLYGGISHFVTNGGSVTGEGMTGAIIGGAIGGATGGYLGYIGVVFAGTFSATYNFSSEMLGYWAGDDDDDFYW